MIARRCRGQVAVVHLSRNVAVMNPLASGAGVNRATAVQLLLGYVVAWIVRGVRGGT